jgi:hypothetical protein
MKRLGLIVVGISCLSCSAWAQNAPGAPRLLRAQNPLVEPGAPPGIVPNPNDCAPFLPQAVWGSNNSARPIGYSCYNASNG